MLKTETKSSDPAALSVNSTVEKIAPASKGSFSTVTTTPKTDSMSKNEDGEKEKDKAAAASSASSAKDKSSTVNPYEWEEVKKARNRINSQRIRERERQQIANLEADRARLWLSNDAIRFQNQHFREIIAQILEVRELKRSRTVAAGGGIGLGGADASTALLGAAMGGGASMQMQAMRANAEMMGGLGGGLVGGLDAAGLLNPNARLSAATVKSLSGLSDADLMARHQATTLEMQSMMRQQEAIGGMGMNINGMINAAAAAASPYADMAENLRIRQLMLQQSASGVGDLESRLSSIGNTSNLFVGGTGNGMGGLGGAGGDDIGFTGGNNSGISALGAGTLGDLGGGLGDADLLQMSKRQKFGF
jgi:hypothetical protein